MTAPLFLRRIFVLLITAVLLMSFFPLPAVHAANPIIANKSAITQWSNVSSKAFASLNVGASGDTLVVIVQLGSAVMPASSCPSTVTSVTSTSSYTFLEGTSTGGTAITNTFAGGNGGGSVTECVRFQVFYATTTSTTAQTITMNFGAATSGNAMAYDWQNIIGGVTSATVDIVSTTVTTGVGGGSVAVSDSNTQSFAAPAAIMVSALALSASTCFGTSGSGTGCGNTGSGCGTGSCGASSAGSAPTAGTGFGADATAVCANTVECGGTSTSTCSGASQSLQNACGAQLFESGSSSAITSPTGGPWTVVCASQCYSFAADEMIVVFGGTTTTTTTTTTVTSVTGAQNFGNCGAKDVTTTNLVNNTLYAYQVNNAIGGAVFNMTIALGAHTYAGNEVLHLAWYNIHNVQGFNYYFKAAEYNFTILASQAAHRTIKFNPSLNSSLLTTPGGSYLMAFMGPNHIKVNQSTGTNTMNTGIIGFSTNPAANVPFSFLTSVLSGTQSPPLFFCSSLTAQPGGGTIFTTLTVFLTSTITSVSTTTINQAGLTTNTNAYFALLVIVSLALILAKFAGMAGAMFGAILGVVVSIMGGFLTGNAAYVSLVMVGLGTVAIIITSANRGGGGGGGM